jgi:hypothetical protein
MEYIIIYIVSGITSWYICTQVCYMCPLSLAGLYLCNAYTCILLVLIILIILLYAEISGSFSHKFSNANVGVALLYLQLVSRPQHVQAGLACLQCV